MTNDSDNITVHMRHAPAPTFNSPEGSPSTKMWDKLASSLVNGSDLKSPYAQLPSSKTKSSKQRTKSRQQWYAAISRITYQNPSTPNFENDGRDGPGWPEENIQVKAVFEGPQGARKPLEKCSFGLDENGNEIKLSLSQRQQEKVKEPGVKRAENQQQASNSSTPTTTKSSSKERKFKKPLARPQSPRPQRPQSPRLQRPKSPLPLVRKLSSSSHHQKGWTVIGSIQKQVEEGKALTLSKLKAPEEDWKRAFKQKNNSSPRSSLENRRPSTAPAYVTSKIHNPFSESEEPKGSEISIATSCLKSSSRPSSKNGRSGVTFAPGTANFERENKPKKLKIRNNRKPKFAHPCCGHFVPPSHEIISFPGADYYFPHNNIYIKFTSIWCGTPGRVSPESLSKRKLRVKRFKALLRSVSIAHETFNKVPDMIKVHLMISEIIPIYISCLDIAIMDDEVYPIERILATIHSSLRILQVLLHDNYFNGEGNPREIPSLPPNTQDFFVHVGFVVLSISKITGEPCNWKTQELNIESLLVKLQLELLILCICPWNCVIFRTQLSVAPGTLERAVILLQAAKLSKKSHIVKWVNDSVMHRDYMGFLKFFGFCDEIGAKNPVPLRNYKDPANEASLPKPCRDALGRPASANPILIRDYDRFKFDLNDTKEFEQFC